MSANYHHCRRKMYHYYQFFTTTFHVNFSVFRLKDERKLFNKKIFFFFLFHDKLYHKKKERSKKWIWICRWWWHLLKQIVYLFIYEMRWGFKMIYITTWENNNFSTLLNKFIHHNIYFLQNTTNNRKKSSPHNMSSYFPNRFDWRDVINFVFFSSQGL